MISRLDAYSTIFLIKSSPIITVFRNVDSDITTYRRWKLWKYMQNFLPQHVGTDCRFAMLVNTCLLTLSVCWFADQHTEFRKRFGLICLGLSSVFLMLVLLMLTVHSLRQYTSTSCVILMMCLKFPTLNLVGTPQ